MTMRTNLLYVRELLKSQQKSKLFRASLSDSSPPPELSHIRREFIIQRRLHLHTILSKGRPGSQLNLGLPEYCSWLMHSHTLQNVLKGKMVIVCKLGICESAL